MPYAMCTLHCTPYRRVTRARRRHLHTWCCVELYTNRSRGVNVLYQYIRRSTGQLSVDNSYTESHENSKKQKVYLLILTHKRRGYCVLQTVRDRIPVAARFCAPVHIGPGAHPSSYTMVTGSFQGVERPGRGVDHPLPYH